jgi:predicted amidohydrolase YtcJ
VGSAADMAALVGPNTQVIDLGGHFLMPGFIDNHVHFEGGSVGLTQVQLRDAATPEEFSRRIIEAAKAAPEGTWVLEGAWDHELWGGALPDRAWIDEGTGGVPVAVSRLDGHMLLCNSAALKLAGITDDTPNPEGGVIVRDASGRATGVIKDNAMSLIFKAVPEMSEAAMEETFKRGMAHAVSIGVTQVHDMGYNWRSLETFRRLEAKGDDWVRWGGLKGFVDGSLGSTTAWFYEPYADAPETSGFPVSDMTSMHKDISGAVGEGLHVAVHAIGYQANDKLLKIYDMVGGSMDASRLRFRIEHSQHIAPASIPKFAAQGVIASMQPFHAIDDGRWAEKRLGKERLAGTYAIGSLMRSGATVTFGSDWPVAPLDPIVGVYAAVTRRTTDGANPDGWIAGEKISVADALRAYTQNNAYAGFQEDRLGMLKAGYLADFVVLSASPFDVAPEAIADIRVERTVIDGKDRYMAN